MHDSLFHSWPVQNAITALLLAGLALLFWRFSRRAYWRMAAAEVFHKKTARICFVILMLYGTIAVLDSVGWRRPLLDPATGEPMRTPQGAVQMDQGASALDYLLLGLSRKKEKSYSAPLAAREYSYSTEKKDGTTRRIRKELKYPRQHILGTDIIGEDILVQSLKSIRTGLIVGLLNTLLAIPFALLFGLCAGYFGGLVDDAVQALCTLLNSIPSLLLIAAIMIIAGRGLPQLCFAMSIASWTGLCRLLRGETLRLREADYIQAARAMGVSAPRILLRHILPNVMHLVLITVVIRFSNEVLAEAALTYLGIGVGADTMSWGTMINDARTELTRTPVIWWKLSAAFLFMVGLVLPANLFGDAVRDALDPRLRK